MARTKKQSATAEEHNQEAAEVRTEAYNRQSSVVDFVALQEAREKRDQLIRDLAARLDTVTEEASAIRDKMKTIRLDAKSNDVDWKALTTQCRNRRIKDSKRIAFEKSRLEIARAFGWQEGLQMDLLDDDHAEGLIPGQQREFMGATDEDGLSPDKRAALDSGFFTREELGLPAEAQH